MKTRRSTPAIKSIVRRSMYLADALREYAYEYESKAKPEAVDFLRGLRKLALKYKSKRAFVSPYIFDSYVRYLRDRDWRGTIVPEFDSINFEGMCVYRTEYPRGYVGAYLMPGPEEFIEMDK